MKDIYKKVRIFQKKKKNEKIKGKYYKIPFQNFTTQIKIPFREFLLYHRCAG